MADITKFNQEMREYFDSLPMVLKEEIVQSSIEFTSTEDLKKYFENVNSIGK